MRPLRPASVLLPLLLGSCQSALDVRVTGSPSVPVIEVEDGDDGAAVRFVGIAPAGTREASWRIEAADCLPVGRIRYGVVPTGFKAEGPAAPLEPGRAYRVVVSGCGARFGGAWFKIAGGRIVSRNGFGDRPQREVEATR